MFIEIDAFCPDPHEIHRPKLYVNPAHIIAAHLTTVQNVTRGPNGHAVPIVLGEAWNIILTNGNVQADKNVDMKGILEGAEVLTAIT